MYIYIYISRDVSVKQIKYLGRMHHFSVTVSTYIKVLNSCRLFFLKKFICPSVMQHILIRRNSFIDFSLECWSYWDFRGRKTGHCTNWDFAVGNTNMKGKNLSGHVLVDTLLFKQHLVSFLREYSWNTGIIDLISRLLGKTITVN